MEIYINMNHRYDGIINTQYFVEQIKKKWPDVKIQDLTEKSECCLKFVTSEDSGIKGIFSGKSVTHQGPDQAANAHFVHWYRSIIPPEWELRVMDNIWSFEIILVTIETTEEEIIAGFNTPFDVFS